MISSRRARGLPGRRPGPQAGSEWLAPRTTDLAGMNPRREEIITQHPVEQHQLPAQEV
jgi:hypothetical protein